VSKTAKAEDHFTVSWSRYLVCRGERNSYCIIH